MPLGRDDLDALLRQHLEPADATAWLAHERPSARLMRARPGAPPAAVLGGEPRMAVDLDWPVWDDQPLDFLADVDLGAVHAVLPGAPLPAEGRLLFFVRSSLDGPDNSIVGAMYPGTRPGWQVLYLPSGTPTAERHRPEAEEPNSRRFRRVECVLAPESTLPDPWAYPRARSLGLDESRLRTFEDEKWERYDRDERPRHRIGGWADPTQLEPTGAVVLADAGLIDGDGQVAWNHADAESLYASGDDDWFLLLQLDTDEDNGLDGTGWMWGDAGLMFFYVRPEQSRAADFSGVWMHWDC